MNMYVYVCITVIITEKVMNVRGSGRIQKEWERDRRPRNDEYTCMKFSKDLNKKNML